VQGKNETLASISKETGFPLQDIQDLNKHIKSSKQKLMPGQEIQLPPEENKPKPGAKKPEASLEDQSIKTGQLGKQVTDQTKTVAGYTGKLGETAEPKLASKLQELEQRAAELQKDLPKLQSEVKGEIRRLVDLSCQGKISPEDFTKQMSKQTENLAKLDTEIRAVEKEMQSVAKASKGAGMVKEFGKTMDKLGSLRNGLGRAAFGLDAAINFNEYQQKDPSNWQYNMTKAINASAANFYLAAKMPKADAAGAAGALLKFGLECTGLKDTPMYDSVDVATQCLPTDIISKGVTQAMDQTRGIMELIGSGGRDAKKLESLNDANLKGENGLVMQGASILGDLVANGGRNVPTEGTGVRLAEGMGFYGHTDVLTRDVGRTAEQKTGLVNKLLEGSTSPDDELKVLNILNQSDPRTMLQTLKGVDRDRLVSELTNRKQAIDPAAALVIDTYLKSNQATGTTQEQLRIMAKDLVFKCQDQNRTEALEDLRQRGVLDKLGIR
jgi:LysM repeat protein